MNYDAVKVFTATKAKEREALGEVMTAWLRRMEGEIAVTRLIRRFPNLSITEEPTFNSRIILRGREKILIDLDVPVEIS